MSKGKCFYQGPANEMLTYFNTNGYQCEPHDNPADFALDILIDVSSKCDDFQRLINIYGEVHAEKFLSKTLKYTDELEQLRRKQTGRAARTFQTEIYFVAQRTLKNSIRNPQLFLSQIIVALILGFLVGLVFYDLKTTIDPGIQNRLGAIFFIVISQIFSTVTALEPLIKERRLFLHVCYCVILN